MTLISKNPIKIILMVILLFLAYNLFSNKQGNTISYLLIVLGLYLIYNDKSLEGLVNTEYENKEIETLLGLDVQKLFGTSVDKLNEEQIKQVIEMKASEINEKNTEDKIIQETENKIKNEFYTKNKLNNPDISEDELEKLFKNYKSSTSFNTEFNKIKEEIRKNKEDQSKIIAIKLLQDEVKTNSVFTEKQQKVFNTIFGKNICAECKSTLEFNEKLQKIFNELNGFNNLEFTQKLKKLVLSNQLNDDEFNARLQDLINQRKNITEIEFNEKLQKLLENRQGETDKEFTKKLQQLLENNLNIKDNNLINNIKEIVQSSESNNEIQSQIKNIVSTQNDIKVNQINQNLQSLLDSKKEEETNVKLQQLVESRQLRMDDLVKNISGNSNLESSNSSSCDASISKAIAPLQLELSKLREQTAVPPNVMEAKLKNFNLLVDVLTEKGTLSEEDYENMKTKMSSNVMTIDEAIDSLERLKLASKTVKRKEVQPELKNWWSEMNRSELPLDMYIPKGSLIPNQFSNEFAILNTDKWTVPMPRPPVCIDSTPKEILPMGTSGYPTGLKYFDEARYVTTGAKQEKEKKMVAFDVKEAKKEIKEENKVEVKEGFCGCK